MSFFSNLDETVPNRPNTPATGHADRWWPRQSRRRPHRQERTMRGKGWRRRRKKSNLKDWESMRDTLSIGMLMNGAEARGPPCDRNKAFCGSVRVPNKRAKLLASTLRAAWDSQPALGWFGFILFWGRRDLTCGQILPTWTHETVRFHTSLADHDGLHDGSLMFFVDGSDDGSSNFGVPLCNHLDGICPTRPVRSMPLFDCAGDGSRIHTNQRAKTTPDLCIMLGGECVGQTGADSPAVKIRPRPCAIQQDQPNALKVLDVRDPLQQCLVRAALSNAPMSGTSAVPHSRLAMVKSDLGVVPQFFSQDLVAIHGSFKIGCDI